MSSDAMPKLGILGKGKHNHLDSEEKARKCRWQEERPDPAWQKATSRSRQPEDFRLKSGICACVGQYGRTEAGFALLTQQIARLEARISAMEPLVFSSRGITICQCAAGVLDVAMKTMDWKLQEVVVDVLFAKLEVKGQKFIVSRKELQGTKQVMKKLQQDFISFSRFFHHVQRQGENFDKVNVILDAATVAFEKQTGIEGSRQGVNAMALYKYDSNYSDAMKPQEMLALKRPKMIKLSLADNTLKLQLTSEIKHFLEEDNGRSTSELESAILEAKVFLGQVLKWYKNKLKENLEE
ncbi:hypothetical protein SELMODRAFT_415268 [Selaginella moellendorffii]|uniref:Uncharacterized protein n=1 Tax=Selaginella moellendorffii TaxID=88036 RepID=D8RVK0_SELML|nr:hypothetical protein SELMODRAFT_415268 [Selaginella moellendorffii]